MDHKTLEAKAVATDQGQFTAIAAAYTVDRTNERILQGAFEKTIDAWQKSGKKIPLHWDHSAAAADIIGTVEPASMKEVSDGLEVKGQLDLEENATAREAWRLMKKDAVALSFGYLVVADAKDSDGVRELKEIDLFEITITPAPANPDTRFTELKSIKQMSPEAMAQKMRAMADEMDDEEMAARMREMAQMMAEMGKSLREEQTWQNWAARNLVAVDAKKCETCGAPFYKQPDSQDWETKRFCSTCETKQAEDRSHAIEDRTEEPDGAKVPQDPLVAQYDDIVARETLRGVDTSQPAVKKAEPEHLPTLEELESQLDDIELDILT